MFCSRAFVHVQLRAWSFEMSWPGSVTKFVVLDADTLPGIEVQRTRSGTAPPVPGEANKLKFAANSVC